MCSAALEAFVVTRTLSAPIQHAKSERVGCRLSEPLDSLIGGVLANQRSVLKGQNLHCVCFVLLCTVFCHFLFECSATRLLHLAQAQNLHATVELAAR